MRTANIKLNKTRTKYDENLTNKLDKIDTCEETIKFVHTIFNDKNLFCRNIDDINGINKSINLMISKSKMPDNNT